MESHTENIECPNCGKRQIAKILHTIPFFTYIHDCISCKYAIMESEWIIVDTQDEIKIKLEADE